MLWAVVLESGYEAETAVNGNIVKLSLSDRGSDTGGYLALKNVDRGFRKQKALD